ncbi:MAG: hypothetical protein AVDCRST_MAG19-3986 [uncultured Thermomicrobiales bacterium]|uniref:Uncharacterized protein n=1 Tax=uncultured Thermomicrobiales bacterium TaxID=1645740 RepID=A0A6J4VKK2_9BACT|nr:MAG: hypothetical protein AVDCRST_MAG19-3986 [uncultured Thermomicrobiales bacterium]
MPPPGAPGRETKRDRLYLPIHSRGLAGSRSCGQVTAGERQAREALRGKKAIARNTAAAGNGGTAGASADGGSVLIDDVNSGGHGGGVIGVGDVGNGGGNGNGFGFVS